MPQPVGEPGPVDEVPVDEVPVDEVPVAGMPVAGMPVDEVPVAGMPVEKMMAADSASRMLGIEVLDHGAGWARVQMTVRDDMVNGHGMCHGGLIFALADTAFACACNSWGPVTVAAGGDIVFVSPARLGDLLVAEGRVRARYGRNGVYDVAVTCGGQLVAEFRGRSHELKERRPG